MGIVEAAVAIARYPRRDIIRRICEQIWRCANNERPAAFGYEWRYIPDTQPRQPKIYMSPETRKSWADLQREFRLSVLKDELENVQRPPEPYLLRVRSAPLAQTPGHRPETTQKERPGVDHSSPTSNDNVIKNGASCESDEPPPLPLALADGINWADSPQEEVQFM